MKTKAENGALARRMDETEFDATVYPTVLSSLALGRLIERLTLVLDVMNQLMAKVRKYTPDECVDSALKKKYMPR